MTKPALPQNYGSILETIKTSIRTARVKAHLAANRELILLYWRIGKLILDTQQEKGWGAKVLEQLSRDLKIEFPEMKGLSRTNLFYMRAFAETWKSDEIVQGAAGQFKSDEISPQAADQIVPQAGGQVEPPEIVQGVLGQIPWWSNIALLDKLDTTEKRLWYAQKTIEHGWSRNVLVHQIETQLYERQAVAEKTTNFELTLPKHESDLVQEMVKDPYTFEFLDATGGMHERDLHKALVRRIQDFLLELGVGFAFVGSNYRLVVGGDEFFIDLLFYHINLRRYVVIELKTGKFDPRDSGQLNFYLTAVDRTIKQEDHLPTIGLILCRSKNDAVAEYSVQGLTQPMSISTFKDGSELPGAMQGALPTPEELERELQAVEDPDDKEEE